MKSKEEKKRIRKRSKIGNIGKINKTRKCILLLLVYNVLFLSPVSEKLPVSAEGLQQSEDQICITLLHEHTEEACYERRWIPCGGSWRTNFEPYVQATVYYCTNNYSTEVVNGVVLSSIHSGWHCDEKTGTHAGEYRNIRLCETEEMGTFTVLRQESEEGVGLNLLPETDASIQYEIWFNGELQTQDNPTVFLTQNGTNEIIFRWMDEINNEWQEEYIMYTDISLPITVRLNSEGETVAEYVVRYGDELPEITPPERAGYEFEGIYYGDTLYYDASGNVTENANSLFLATEQNMEASWKAKEYAVRYGDDLDADGLPDQIMEVIYGENYESVLPPESGAGVVFAGYFIGEEKVFDSEGNPTGVWRWDIEEELALEAVFVAPPSQGNGQDNSSASAAEEHQTQNLPGNTSANESEQEKETCISEDGAVSENSVSNNGINENEIHESEPNGNTIGRNDTENSETLNEDLINANQGEGVVNPGEEVTGETGVGQMLGESVEREQAQETRVEEVRVNVELPTYEDASTTRELGFLRKGNVITTVAFAVSTFLAVLGLWTVVYYLFLFRTVMLYSGERSKGRKMGRLWLRHKEGGFFIKISEKMVDAMQEGQLEICFSDAFVQKHKNKDLLVQFPLRTVEETVQKGLRVRMMK